ncbi:MAG: exo-alpha-sialidase [Nitrospinae bacterium]|nr:exo-alpha-sialidase [Nitrospinota bacterium]
MMRMRHIGCQLAKLMAMAWIMGFASLLGSREAWPGAASFTPISQLHHMHGLAVSPRDPRTLYIATHEGLIRLMEGKRWELVGEDRSDFMGFSLDPATAAAMYASGHPSGASPRVNPVGVIVSRDGGQSWQSLTLEGKADMHAMALSADGMTLYGWNVMPPPGLYRISTKDGTWTKLQAAQLQDVFSLATHPRQQDTLLASTRSGLLQSGDGGRSWAPLSQTLAGVPVTVATHHPRDPQILYAYAVRKDLGFMRSMDGGRNWTPLGFFLEGRDGVAVIAVSSQEGEVLYLSTFSSDLYASGDGGKSWRLLARQGKPVSP